MTIKQSFVRVLVAHKGELRNGYNKFPEPHGDMNHEDGSKTYFTKIADGNTVRDYACGLELTAAEFHYIPDVSEISYIILRMRGQGCFEGYKPAPIEDRLSKNNPFFEVWCQRVDNQGEPCFEYWVQTPFAKIRWGFQGMHNTMSPQEISNWREHCLNWTEEQIIILEECEQFERDLQFAVAKQAYNILIDNK